MALSYLLGLDWRIPREMRELKERATSLKKLKKAVTAEDLGAIFPTSASLRPEIARAEERVDRLSRQIRRFDEVERFQASVLENRRRYLKEQIDHAEAELSSLETRLADAGARRSELLKTLSGKGAFEDLLRLNERWSEESSRLEALREKLKNANLLEDRQADIKRENAELEQRLGRYAANEENIKAATALVDHAISELYDDRQGNLLIEPHEDGPHFKLSIGGGGNQGGIDQMKVFCFDLMLFQRTSDRLGGPGFLIHDSHLFDGVDPRQTRRALLLGCEAALAKRGQYLVLMNSDNFEKLNVPADRRLANAVLTTRLTDDEYGGLFGFRFDLPRGA